MQVRLRNVNGHNNLRTSEVEGVALDFPECGNRFSLISRAPLTPGFSHRVVITSTVREVSEIIPGVVYIFRTLNSEYELEILNPNPEAQENV